MRNADTDPEMWNRALILDEKVDGVNWRRKLKNYNLKRNHCFSTCSFPQARCHCIPVWIPFWVEYGIETLKKIMFLLGNLAWRFSRSWSIYRSLSQANGVLTPLFVHCTAFYTAGSFSTFPTSSRTWSFVIGPVVMLCTFRWLHLHCDYLMKGLRSTSKRSGLKWQSLLKYCLWSIWM